jgi:signal transduction histidine kinase
MPPRASGGGTAWSLRRRLLLLTAAFTVTSWVVGGVLMYVVEAQSHARYALLAIPLALSLAILVALSAWFVSLATQALDDSARQMTERSPEDLRPVQVADAPTELTPILAAVNALLERMQSVLASERRFTSAAAHELRTPLAAIKIQAQVALLTGGEEERRNALQRLIQVIDSAAHMVEQLLTLSRIDGLMALRAQSTRLPLDAVAGHVIDEMRPLAARRGQQIEEELAEADVLGVEFGVAVLLRNLVDNALRYSPEGSAVRVRIGTVEGAPELQVDDAGPGIPAAERGRVFERFYRAQATAHIDGCGIGLSIVQAVVEMHKASVHLDASELGGLRVAVRFPALSLTEQAGLAG